MSEQGEPKQTLDLVQAFREAWRNKQPPALEDFVPSATSERRLVLLELVRADLECRLKSGLDVHLEDYVERYPELHKDLDELRRWREGALLRETVTATSPSGMSTTPKPVEGPSSVPSLAGYEILGVLGRGGMGVVYKARQLNLKRVVALKTILSGAHAQGDELTRFRREAEAVARLQHPNIVQIFDIGTTQDGTAYFSLELVDGGTLSARLKEAPLAASAAATLLGTLARAVHHAHERGIVHRDLKPANVLLMKDGTPKISDFGLAKEIEADSSQTRTGAVMGTPSYMAPEQALGKVHEIGPPTDVYSLGAVLYDALTGRPPFKGASVLETLEQVRTREPLPPSQVRKDVPRDLDTICLKALAKDARQRYVSALALANDLDRFRAGEPILARRQGIAGRAWRKLRRNAGKVATAAAVLGIVMLAVALILNARTSSRQADLERQIIAALDEEQLQGTADYVARVEYLVAELDKLDVAAGAGARQKLWDRLAAWVHKQIAQTTAPAETAVRVQPMIRLLADKNPDLAKGLQKDLDDRLERWDAAFELTAPFADAGKVFAADQFRIAGKALHLVASKASLPGAWLTGQESPRHAEARAVFAHPDWERAGEIGLALNASAKGKYTFIVRIAEPAKDKDAVKATVGEDYLQRLRVSGGTVRLQIRRNNVMLVQRSLAASEIPAGPLELWAKREGERLSCQLNRFKVLEFIDPFPLPSTETGVFGLVSSTAPAVLRFAAFRKKLAVVPSPLEQADILFEEKRFDEALNIYRRPAAAGGDPELAQQARYKEALCLLESRRDGEAIVVLRDLANSTGKRWPPLADCQLYLLLVERKNADSRREAMAVLDRLLGRQLAEESLVMVLPESSRQRLLSAHYLPVFDQYFGSNREKIEIVRLLQHAVALQRLALADFDLRKSTEAELVRAYRLAGMEIEAEALAREILNAYDRFDHADVVRKVLSQYCWILRRAGRATEARAELDRRLVADPRSAGGVVLLPERARTHAALGNWLEAEKDIDAVLSRQDPAVYIMIDALCLKGMLRERAGDPAGARAAWQKAAGKSFDRPGESAAMVACWIMASLSDSLTDDDCRRIQSLLLTRLSGDAQAKQLLDMAISQQPLALYRDMWRTPRGRDLARKWAFHQCSYAEWGLIPFFLNVAETAHQLAFPGPLSPEHDKLIWDLVQDSYRSYAAEKLTKEQLVTLGITFKGVSWFWGGVKDKLEPSLQGPMAYLFAHRYLPRDRKQAEAFFRTALEKAPAGSTLQRLAQAELAKLKTP